MCTSNHPVGTTYASAPTKTVTAGGTTYAYRELGPKGGIPVVFLVHLAANLDNWDPASSTRSPGTVTSSRSTMSASVHHPGRFPTRSKRWQRTPTPSFRHSISTPSISSRSRWGGLHRPGSSSRAPRPGPQARAYRHRPTWRQRHRQCCRTDISGFSARDVGPSGPEGISVLQPQRRG